MCRRRNLLSNVCIPFLWDGNPAVLVVASAFASQEQLIHTYIHTYTHKNDTYLELYSSDGKHTFTTARVWGTSSKVK